MNNLDWQERLQSLCNRFAHLGMCADLASLQIIAAWGVYSLLRRLAGDE